MREINNLRDAKLELRGTLGCKCNALEKKYNIVEDILEVHMYLVFEK